MAMVSIQCYNRGCRQKYSPEINPGDACQFHPGAPFFHETYKGWTCCNKKFSDFTEFLNTPGCAKGPHSNVKPEEPEHITGQVGDANNVDLPQVSENVPDRESFESVKNWVFEIEKYAQENVNKLLIGNKCDQTAKRAVTLEEGQDLARQLKIDFIETSAKEVMNVDKVFKIMAENILNRITHGTEEEAPNQLSNNRARGNKEKSDKSCC